MEVRRGEVWLCDFGMPIGHEQGYVRPALVVSADPLHAIPAGLAVVVPTTTRFRAWPTHVEIALGASGLRETSWAKVEDIRSVSTCRFRQRLGAVNPDALDRVSVIARRLLAL